MKEALYPNNPILVIDDEQNALNSININLQTKGINNIELCNDSRKTINIIQKKNIEVILCDLIMPHVTGEEILTVISEKFPQIPIIVITGINDVKTAVNCMKLGAFDYLTKPIDPDRLFSTVKHALEYRELKHENEFLADVAFSHKTRKLNDPGNFAHIVTQNKDMFTIFKYIEAIARSPRPVLITGETGTGKELIAEAIHKAGIKNGKFIPVNTAGLDESVFSDTLFGHKKGAFTGASETRKGLIETAANGTLFLDEIGDLSSKSQIKLLRLIQEKKYMPLGSDLPKTTNLRIITATNKDLFIKQQNDEFRKDLYYRICSHHIHIPPLRERKEDIPILTELFLNKACKSLDKARPYIPKELYALLDSFHFPGNVRELEAMVFDAVSKNTSKTFSLSGFTNYIQENNRGNNKEVSQTDFSETFLFPETMPTLKTATELIIKEAMKRAQNNQSLAARILGISHQAINQRLKKMNS